MESSEPEFKRQRKRTSLDPVTCPICSITIRENELEAHYNNELEKLTKIKRISQNKSSPATSPSTSNKTKVGEGSASINKDDTPENCWGMYQKIKENRMRRTTKIKNRKRKPEDRICPICSTVVTEDLQVHVEICLKKQEENASSESEDEIDVGESYSWCGQTRIRATTLLEGSLSSTGVGTIITKATEDDDDSEVNIDGDEELQLFGPTQYSERDIILLNKEDQRLRDLVIGFDAPSTSRAENNQNVANSIPSPAAEKFDSDSEKLTTSSISSVDSTNEHSSSQQIIESLKTKIREYESFIKNKPKCLICLDDYKKPVVSICCWHVHCEICWLHTLGARKLCPSCNMITSASDLRRIYL